MTFCTPTTTATIFTCLTDATLVLLQPIPPTDPNFPDYASWQLVQAPGGQWGWVQKEFLQFVNPQSGSGVR
jgi:hypothetical protein